MSQSPGTPRTEARGALALTLTSRGRVWAAFVSVKHGDTILTAPDANAQARVSRRQACARPRARAQRQALGRSREVAV